MRNDPRTFLDEVAHNILRQNQKMENTLVMLPSRRACFFFEEAVKDQLTKISWLPQIMSVEDFVERLSNFRNLPTPELILETYPFYREVFGNESETFRDYLNWITIMLADFNEVDAYKIEIKKLFEYLRDERALKSWNIDGSEMTDFQKRYLDFWEHLEPLYKKLTAHFEKHKMGYQGFIYRQAAEHVSCMMSNRFPLIQNIHWVGFNALNTCEEELVDYFIEHLDCQLHFDVDPYYLENQKHEAGRFIRNYLKRWPQQSEPYSANGFSNPQKEIETFGVSGKVGMAKVAGALLGKEGKRKNTALVLADENLLNPVLSSLPQSVDNINITLGYSLQTSLTYSFTESVLNALVNAKRASKNTLFTEDLLSVYAHPAFHYFGDQSTVSEKLGKLRESQKVAFTHTELLQFEKGLFDEPFTKKILNPNQSPGSWLNYATNLLERKANDENKVNDKLEQFHLERLVEVLIRTADYLEDLTDKISFEELWRFVILSAQGETIPIEGEKSDYLQLMGMLETRCLDFDHLIMTSVNEGTLPAGKQGNSFIPFEVKRKFQLPTHIQKDAIFAYHFYRVLQRAKKVTLLYDTSVSDMGMNEESRFIRQLEVEWGLEGNRKWNKQNISFDRDPLEFQVNSIEKTDDVLGQIRDYLTSENRGLSPSALNKYFNSPADFYFRHPLGIKEKNELEKDIEVSTFGTAVHDALEELFKRFVDSKQLLKKDDVLALKSEVRLALTEKMKESFKGDLNIGSNYLTFHAALKMIDQFLELQANELEDGDTFAIVGQEKKERTTVFVDDVEIRLNGTADRIDSFDTHHRIVDYKTGSVEQKELVIGSIDDLFDFEKQGKDKARQVMFYAWLVHKTKGYEQIESGIYSLKKISGGFLKLKVGRESILQKEHFERFEELLKNTIREMLNPDKELIQPETSSWTLYE
ncbi:PD-(D/E)XK nuclease family protein [Salibacter sp.]|uniref:PD-(D/E)XK nuclease family protein n=1 Tax=Salibacter sp. TaxID=2010995 RepID=UPI00287007BF|nr:PD-(D/E)XK nuclease family protein [Salibacter sp.]MDR9488569.1 PD-(D/E)XK nuclease family protein [Salibacter sp.]